MDGAAMAGTTQKGRLRQQILNGEQDIDALSQRQQQVPGTPPMMQYGQMAPMGPMGGSMVAGGMESRKSSFTSQSGINRLFGRNRNNAAAFNEDLGEDIQELSMGGNMSIDDISHIRDRGPYGLSAAKTLDTTPFIPTLGTMSGSNPNANKTVNNIQYRKQMNHSKKIALANGARAMSLAGSNPMMAQQQSDPRAMSLSTFGGAGPRTMSLSSNGAPVAARGMSLTSRGPIPQNYGMPPQGMPPNNMMPQGMSSRNSMNYYPPQQYGPGQYQGPMPPQGPRTMSMNSNYNMYGRPANGQYMGAPPPVAGQNYARSMSMNNFSQQNARSPNMRSPHNSYSGYPPPPTSRMDQQQNSNDSLSNVVEEEESDDAQNKREQTDHNGNSVHHFEEDEEAASLSRKSTIKKSNSMRLRKLNLFEEDNSNGQTSKNNASEDEGEKRYSLVHDDSPEGNARNNENRRKLQSLGASVENGTSSTKDVYFTASNFTTPLKSPSDLPSPNIKEDHNDTIDGLSPTKGKINEDDDDVTLKDRGSPTGNETEIGATTSLKKIRHKSSLKSLVANTAFSNFRSPSKENMEVIKSKSSSSLADQQVPDESKEVEESENTEGISTGFNTSESLAHSPDKMSLNSKEIVEQSTPPTTNSSSNSQPYDAKAGSKGEYSGSKESSVYGSPFVENQNQQFDSKGGVERKNSRSFSLSGKSRNLFKRLSKSGRRSSSYQDDDESVGENISLKRISSSYMNSSYTSVNPGINRTELQQFIELKEEDFDVVKRNNDLLNELDLVTTELASSIKRELALEFKISDNNHSQHGGTDQMSEITRRSDTITQLQEKLNKERRLRSITEEHALYLEKGQNPSPLKLDYEKAELYKQLIIKNDLVNQLQDKINELELQGKESPPDILERYNELLKENTELKIEVIPELEKRITSLQTNSNTSANKKQLNLVSEDPNDYYDRSYEEISILKNHRDELREVVAKLTASHSFEMKTVREKYKILETKYKNLKSVNDKMSQRVDSTEGPVNSFSSNVHSLNKGGKLQGFTIVSPNRSFFDEES